CRGQGTPLPFGRGRGARGGQPPAHHPRRRLVPRPASRAGGARHALRRDIPCAARPAAPLQERLHRLTEFSAMSLRVAVQMDPIASINPLGDSTFALMLEAQERGHSLVYYTP